MTDMKIVKDFSEMVVREFNPEKIILFGSYAYGTPHPHSDVDILVILPFKGSPFRKSLEILNRLDPRFPIDLLARDPEETTRRYRQGDPLIREAVDKGTVLYERCH